MAYYSKLKPTVYHECRNCSVGNNMVKKNLGTGMPPEVKMRGGKTRAPRLCRTCATLQRTGQCVPGIPDLPEPFSGDTVEIYYSKESPKIFHMCQNCYLGQNIDKNNLETNKPPPENEKARLCKICVKLCVEGTCIPGAPIPAEKIKSRYYSNAHTPPRVFHACNNCYIGQRIANPTRAKVAPDKARLCRICYRLLKEEKCT